MVTERAVSEVVIVGGGTAGWLAACLIAARGARSAHAALAVTLVESPDVATIGVGEGTWPTMRATLEAIGIAEAEFLLACDAAFKQGSRFVGWRDGEADDAYLHPFTAPAGDPRDIVGAWRDDPRHRGFAEVVSPQPHVAARHLAPRQRAMPDYAGALNYAYHLDAGKFAALLSRHAVQRLGVRHVRDHVTGVVAGDGGDIAAVTLRDGGDVAGDLFLDCTGHAALLIGGHYGVPFVDRGDELFNDRALALQLPVAPDSAIASQTDATAHRAGWIWDIGLPQRRGIGCVYSSRHIDDDAATEVLRAYVAHTAPTADFDALSPRRLAFRSGHRARFWQGNCIAIGLSAGFLEPLEASAIVMIELSLGALLAGFPTRDTMTLHARRFNDLFAYRWDRIVEFLKLHYVLSRRDEPYWRDNRDAATVPQRLADLLAIWRHQPPSQADFPHVDEVFPAASYQYVLYGMGFPAPAGGEATAVAQQLAQVEHRSRGLAAALPTNRAYLDALAATEPPAAMKMAAR